MVPTHSGDYPKKGYFPPESVVPFKQNQVGLSNGISGYFPPEWGGTLLRNTQVEYIFSRATISKDTYEPHVARFRMRSALNNSLSASAFIQYSSDLRQLSSNIRIRYNPSEGVDLYIVYNEGMQTSLNHEFSPLRRTLGRSILIKFNYTFIR